MIKKIIKEMKLNTYHKDEDLHFGPVGLRGNLQIIIKNKKNKKERTKQNKIKGVIKRDKKKYK